jgi:hypothetical protein
MPKKVNSPLGLFAAYDALKIDFVPDLGVFSFLGGTISGRFPT